MENGLTLVLERNFVRDFLNEIGGFYRLAGVDADTGMSFMDDITQTIDE